MRNLLLDGIVFLVNIEFSVGFSIRTRMLEHPPDLESLRDRSYVPKLSMLLGFCMSIVSRYKDMCSHAICRYSSSIMDCHQRIIQSKDR